MRPPLCFVCGLSPRDLPEGDDSASAFTLVHFALDVQERAAQEARDRDGWVGHPENAEWFCAAHADAARAHAHLHWREALAALASRGDG
ncbi:hypothetical protein GCM10023085_08160 [Actinomadura viridis]|uniref:Uncharacterized protein n=1 Tax=Actinomadura viridis TaxID=58110 RepID=A0A931DPU6_9ACTN|nr:hypothetical protein [Actinomadura viridis]MBG6091827.1 hypothetical protein [Actinomadura viridis]